MRILRIPNRGLVAGVAAGLAMVGAGGSPAADFRARTPHADGPPLARTGGFGELTCAECHLDLPLNASGGALLIEGVPGVFTPGRAYVITVVVEGEGMGSAGFQAAARFREGERRGRPAGRLAPLDGRTIVRSEGGIDYINHTFEEATWGLATSPAGASNGWRPGIPRPSSFTLAATPPTVTTRRWATSSTRRKHSRARTDDSNTVSAPPGRLPGRIRSPRDAESWRPRTPAKTPSARYRATWSDTATRGLRSSSTDAQRDRDGEHVPHDVPQRASARSELSNWRSMSTSGAV